MEKIFKKITCDRCKRDTIVKELEPGVYELPDIGWCKVDGRINLCPDCYSEYQTLLHTLMNDYDFLEVTNG